MMINYYSKLIVIEMLKKLQSSTAITKCKKIFSPIMGLNSLAIISNRFQEPVILNIAPLVSTFTNQMD